MIKKLLIKKLLIISTTTLILFRAYEGYIEGKNCNSTFCNGGQTFEMSAAEAEKELEKLKTSYQLQKQVDPAKSTLDSIESIKSRIFDESISVHGLLDELEKLNQMLDNPFISGMERENLNLVRNAVVNTVREYGQENPEFLAQFNKAELEYEEYISARFDPEILKLYKIFGEQGVEALCKEAKKMIRTDKGKAKLQRCFGDSTINGEKLLDILERD